MSCSNPTYLPFVVDFRKRPVPIPCGLCLSCKRDKVSSLEQRAKWEYNNAPSSCFVTFTYDDNHLPFENGSCRPTLRKLDFHRYIDNVRHLLRKSPDLPRNVKFDFSYIGCGEYGDKFRRPHYHVIFFGLPFDRCKSFLQSHWNFGSIDVRAVKPGAIRYVLKYISKQVKGDSLDSVYFDTLRESPFVSYSRSFGAGLFREQQSNIARYGVLRFGRKVVSVPVYWKNKFLNLSVSNILDIERERKKREDFEFLTVAKPRGFNSYDDYKFHSIRVREEDEYFKRVNNRQQVFHDYSFPHQDTRGSSVGVSSIVDSLV